MAKKKTAKKKTARKAKTTAKAKPAKGKVNKSAAIREFAAKNPGMGPTAISKELSAQGIAMSPSFVSVVLTKKKSPKKSGAARGPGRPRKAASGASSSLNGALTIDQLKAAKKFANSVGGISEAKAAINALAAVMEA